MNDLKHFGIPGMRWGIRRKNPDGSTKQRGGSEDFKRTKQLRKKKLKDLSNNEIKDLNNRLQLEKQYKELTRKKISFGRKKVTEILSKVGGDLVSAAVKGFTERMAEDFASRYGPGGSAYSRPSADVIDLKFLKD